MEVLDMFGSASSGSSSSEEDSDGEASCLSQPDSRCSPLPSDTSLLEASSASSESQSDSGISSEEVQASPKKLVGRRRNRAADKVRSIFAIPDLLRSCQNFQVECCRFSEDPFSVVSFRRRDMWEQWQTLNPDEQPNQVVVAVEATAICSMDLATRRGAACGDVPFPFVLGSNFVGVVHHCGPAAEENGIKPGTRVASIVKWGSNSKFVSIPAENISVVPTQLDAAEISSLISSYLPAFQALHHGRPRPCRYSRNILQGKRVLVTGGALLEVQALLRLARFAGATDICVTAPRKHFAILKRHHVTVLDENPNEWLRVAGGRMDVVVDYTFPKNFSEIRKSLARKGRLVCLTPQKSPLEKDGWLSDIESFFERYQLSMMKRASMFDFMESFEMYPEKMHEDLMFLLKLLGTRQIRPQIDRFIKLQDVPAAHKDMQTRPLTGAIVCEPWRE